MTGTALRNLLAACAAAVALAGGARAAAPAAGAGDWRGARWGMTEDEVLKAFPREARRLDKPEKLADGNVVALAIEKQVVGSTEFRVRFVFDPAGKLALVSLRTDPRTFYGPAVYDSTRKALEETLGKPGQQTSDSNYVDLRQATWWTARSRVDVKYIDGVVVVLYSPTDGGPKPQAPEVPPLLQRPSEPGAPKK